jgi:hypothetical protein
MRIQFNMQHENFVLDNTTTLKGVNNSMSCIYPIPMSELHAGLKDVGGHDRSTYATRSVMAASSLGGASEFVEMKNERADDVAERCKGASSTLHGNVVDFELAASEANTPKKVDPCTRKIMKFLESMGIVKLSCQLMVFSERSKIATAIDMLCVHRDTGTPVVVEVKASTTDSLAYYMDSLCPMDGTLSPIPFSQRNRDMLQLVATMSLFREMYGEAVDAVDGLLLRTCPSGILCCPVTPWWKAIAPVLRDELDNAKVRRREERAAVSKETRKARQREKTAELKRARDVLKATTTPKKPNKPRAKRVPAKAISKNPVNTIQ